MNCEMKSGSGVGGDGGGLGVVGGVGGGVGICT